MVLKVLISAKRGKKKYTHKEWKGRSKCPLFSDDTIAYTGNQKEFKEVLLELISEFSKTTIQYIKIKYIFMYCQQLEKKLNPLTDISKFIINKWTN